MLSSAEVDATTRELPARDTTRDAQDADLDDYVVGRACHSGGKRDFPGGPLDTLEISVSRHAGRKAHRHHVGRHRAHARVFAKMGMKIKKETAARTDTIRKIDFKSAF